MNYLQYILKLHTDVKYLLVGELYNKQVALSFVFNYENGGSSLSGLWNNIILVFE